MKGAQALGGDRACGIRVRDPACPLRRPRPCPPGGGVGQGSVSGCAALSSGARDGLRRSVPPGPGGVSGLVRGVVPGRVAESGNTLAAVVSSTERRVSPTWAPSGVVMESGVLPEVGPVSEPARPVRAGAGTTAGLVRLRLQRGPRAVEAERGHPGPAARRQPTIRPRRSVWNPPHGRRSERASPLRDSVRTAVAEGPRAAPCVPGRGGPSTGEPLGVLTRVDDHDVLASGAKPSRAKAGLR